MTRRPLLMLTTATFACGAAAFSAKAGTDETCRTVTFLNDGTVLESTAPLADAQRGAAAAATGGATARSSVSVSSADGAGGRSSASASSYVDGDGRRITITRDETGCTITKDERAAKGE